MYNRIISITLTRGIHLFLIATLISLLTGLFADTRRVQADTYIVTNTNNSGPGSLRQAITNANNTPRADIITFEAASTDRIPIVLAGAADEDDNTSGDLDILDGGNLIIQGNGTRNTIIDGDLIDRVVHICPGGGCTNTVTISGVTIKNGSTTTYGAGIFSEAGTTIVDGSTVIDNNA